MKLYTSVGPSPMFVLAFMAERGIHLATEEVDIVSGAHLLPTFLAKNPAGKLPLLELRPGDYIAESTAICEYLDEITPGISLYGTTAEERAQSRMWLRRLDISIVQPILYGWRWAEGLKYAHRVMRCIPHAAKDIKAIATDGLAWVNANMHNNSYILAGRGVSVADVFLYVAVEFADASGQPVDDQLTWLKAWRGRMRQHAGAAAVDFNAPSL